MSPEAFLCKYENANYLELLKLKNELVQSISDFENDYDQEKFDWSLCPLPDVYYQWNLQVLSKVVEMLQEAFNNEYESGVKTISDYYEDLKGK